MIPSCVMQRLVVGFSDLLGLSLASREVLMWLNLLRLTLVCLGCIAVIVMCVAILVDCRRERKKEKRKCENQ